MDANLCFDERLQCFDPTETREKVVGYFAVELFDHGVYVVFGTREERIEARDVKLNTCGGLFTIHLVLDRSTSPNRHGHELFDLAGRGSYAINPLLIGNNNVVLDTLVFLQELAPTKLGRMIWNVGLTRDDIDVSDVDPDGVGLGTLKVDP